MAVSFGLFALGAARSLRPHAPDRWLLAVAGAASIGFALGFFALGFRWLRLEPLAFLVWMSSYFGFNAICMLGLGPRLNRLHCAAIAGVMGSARVD